MREAGVRTKSDADLSDSAGVELPAADHVHVAAVALN
jgi:hypothetical protein